MRAFAARCKRALACWSDIVVEQIDKELLGRCWRRWCAFVNGYRVVVVSIVVVVLVVLLQCMSLG